MSESINSGNNNISISDFLRVNLDSWNLLLPKDPLSIINPDLEIDEYVGDSSLSFHLIKHGWQLNLMWNDS